jgi:hypothetical protein
MERLQPFSKRKYQMSIRAVVMVKKPCKNQIGPKGKLDTYNQWIRLPELLRAMLSRLYDPRSFVAKALINIGRFPATNIKLETVPAITRNCSISISGPPFGPLRSNLCFPAA